MLIHEIDLSMRPHWLRTGTEPAPAKHYGIRNQRLAWLISSSAA